MKFVRLATKNYKLKAILPVHQSCCRTGFLCLDARLLDNLKEHDQTGIKLCSKHLNEIIVLKILRNSFQSFIGIFRIVFRSQTKKLKKCSTATQQLIFTI